MTDHTRKHAGDASIDVAGFSAVAVCTVVAIAIDEAFIAFVRDVVGVDVVAGCAGDVEGVIDAVGVAVGVDDARVADLVADFTARAGVHTSDAGVGIARLRSVAEQSVVTIAVNGAFVAFVGNPVDIDVVAGCPGDVGCITDAVVVAISTGGRARIGVLVTGLACRTRSSSRDAGVRIAGLNAIAVQAVITITVKHALVAFVGNIVGVQVVTRATGNVGCITDAVVVAVGTVRIARVGGFVADLPGRLTLGRSRNARIHVARFRTVAEVAVIAIRIDGAGVALVGDVVGVGVLAGAIGDIDIVTDTVGIAVCTVGDALVVHFIAQLTGATWRRRELTDIDEAGFDAIAIQTVAAIDVEDALIALVGDVVGVQVRTAALCDFFLIVDPIAIAVGRSCDFADTHVIQ